MYKSARTVQKVQICSTVTFAFAFTFTFASAHCTLHTAVKIVLACLSKFVWPKLCEDTWKYGFIESHVWLKCTTKKRIFSQVFSYSIDSANSTKISTISQHIFQ
ncbi:hypothetical protein J3Q64DRAFT_1700043 [Phycomyces blakesleeanus]|uniref:Uncharacterized protein n=2 Tax=Phycomyces blakesleeanus TaxID=4837 RepID=A0A162NFY6_PHYB8|nr:hypothetical protein PHYBLDRAFT_64842 [Phycomyces blakesleeanus NRRL 1555(-)]OAD73888.1 hypothetical protein PHYBLDRAFT_64842 [Phycomyces blakesleeanus NRRL 1555(-)]|eukprot:XP_018291928.1 hypothetical protein PHYBLDRAFT_64842 [Phycomyces blakesleeanus NRRL 1555(-)]